MKKVLLLLTTLLMIAPVAQSNPGNLSAAGLKLQDQLNNADSINDLYQVEEIDFTALNNREKKKLENFLFNRRFICKAQNARGRGQVRVAGKNKRNVRRRAVAKCREKTRRPRLKHTCQVVGCQQQGGYVWDLLDEVLD